MPPRNERPIANAKVAAIFAAATPAMRRKLLALRRLILETAAESRDVAALDETLRWGEPAYVCKTGSPIRIAPSKSEPTRKYAMFFICTTTLVDSFRTLFPNVFRYQGNRAIEFDLDDDVPIPELKICISMALTYHAKKKS
jgi:Domain of unknown function (DU1801)